MCCKIIPRLSYLFFYINNNINNKDKGLFYSLHVHIFNFPLYLQSVSIHSANVVKSYTMACRRVLTGTLYLIGLESSCELGSANYKLNNKLYLHIEYDW
jgi:hypothetical protein